ncbi:glycosyltransferase [Nonomuraea sp. CA-143628]|uniref:glycosyltransferase n=1 Tax=Nonomuraea sp. CA-143628 TaxID=3239997 RepID=UPI003D91B62F
MGVAAPRRGWVVISDYPRWPSPYFAELQRHVPPSLPLAFCPGLQELPAQPDGPAVVNLHRLKRLYRAADGRRTPQAAAAMLERLAELRAGGWRLVWTVHNLLPIDGGPPTEADQQAAHGVLELVDAVVTHTRADAAHLATVTRAPITVAGWAGLTASRPGGEPSPVVESLARYLRDAPYAVLILGNLTGYKGLDLAAAAFLEATRRARLLIAGPGRDSRVTARLAALAAAGGGRILLYAQRVEPAQVPLLYQAADAALCPYRVDGPWQFFTSVLYPGSVGTALAFGTPVIAPALPAIAEMTTGRPARLYRPADGPGPALAAAEAGGRTPARPPADDATTRWRAVGAAYQSLFDQLTQPSANRGETRRA